MNRVKVIRYQCDFCGRKKAKRSAMLDHERHCFKNAGRIPYEGEMSDYGYRAGPDDAEWPPEEGWEWPGSRMIFRDGQWVTLPKEANLDELCALAPRYRIEHLWPTELHTTAMAGFGGVVEPFSGRQAYPGSGNALSNTP